jgi:signal transduction histidine kinase
LRVADTGVGIEPEHLPHLFERFYRADQSRARVAGGSGLGLAISQWIATAHGGDISVESTLGEGTTFTVRLPISSVPAATRTPGPADKTLAKP